MGPDSTSSVAPFAETGGHLSSLEPSATSTSSSSVEYFQRCSSQDRPYECPNNDCQSSRCVTAVPVAPVAANDHTVHPKSATSSTAPNLPANSHICNVGSTAVPTQVDGPGNQPAECRWHWRWHWRWTFTGSLRKDFFGLCGIIVAIYFGWETLAYAKWEAAHDFREGCQSDLQYNRSLSPECVTAISEPTQDLPQKRLAARGVGSSIIHKLLSPNEAKVTAVFTPHFDSSPGAESIYSFALGVVTTLICGIWIVLLLASRRNVFNPVISLARSSRPSQDQEPSQPLEVKNSGALAQYAIMLTRHKWTAHWLKDAVDRHSQFKAILDNEEFHDALSHSRLEAIAQHVKHRINVLRLRINIEWREAMDYRTRSLDRSLLSQEEITGFQDVIKDWDLSGQHYYESSAIHKAIKDGFPDFAQDPLLTIDDSSQTAGQPSRCLLQSLQGSSLTDIALLPGVLDTSLIAPSLVLNENDACNSEHYFEGGGTLVLRKSHQKLGWKSYKPDSPLEASDRIINNVPSRHFFGPPASVASHLTDRTILRKRPDVLTPTRSVSSKEGCIFLHQSGLLQSEWTYLFSRLTGSFVHVYPHRHFHRAAYSIDAIDLLHFDVISKSAPHASSNRIAAALKSSAVSHFGNGKRILYEFQLVPTSTASDASRLKAYTFAATSEQERDEWVRCLSTSKNLATWLVARSSCT